MGVPKLWELVQEAGYQVEYDSLEGQVLAIDASIWIHSFIKTLKNSKGDPLPYAHLIGFFRRIVKLLSHNVKPIFVFDGNVPYLKKQTMNTRRRRREEAEDRIEKSNRRLLLIKTIKNQLAGLKKKEEDNTTTTNEDEDDFDFGDYDFDQDDDVDSDLEIIDGNNNSLTTIILDDKDDDDDDIDVSDKETENINNSIDDEKK